MFQDRPKSRLSNFDSGYLSEITLNLEVVKEEISIFSFAGHFVQLRRNVCEILKLV